MRAVIQRVGRAAVTIDGEQTAAIGHGLLVLLGIEREDEPQDVPWLARKIANLRIFGDADDVMNESVTAAEGEVLVVSQFTLHAKTKKGNRPSYTRAAPPEQAVPLYETFVQALAQAARVPVKTGSFGAMMQVSLVNDGPVTIIIDSRQRDL